MIFSSRNEEKHSYLNYLLTSVSTTSSLVWTGGNKEGLTSRCLPKDPWQDSGREMIPFPRINHFVIV